MNIKKVILAALYMLACTASNLFAGDFPKKYDLRRPSKYNIVKTELALHARPKRWQPVQPDFIEPQQNIPPENLLTTPSQEVQDKPTATDSQHPSNPLIDSKDVSQPQKKYNQHTPAQMIKEDARKKRWKQVQLEIDPQQPTFVVNQQPSKPIDRVFLSNDLESHVLMVNSQKTLKTIEHVFPTDETYSLIGKPQTPQIYEPSQLFPQGLIELKVSKKAPVQLSLSESKQDSFTQVTGQKRALSDPTMPNEKKNPLPSRSYTPEERAALLKQLEKKPKPRSGPSMAFNQDLTQTVQPKKPKQSTHAPLNTFNQPLNTGSFDISAQPIFVENIQLPQPSMLKPTLLPPQTIEKVEISFSPSKFQKVSGQKRKQPDVNPSPSRAYAPEELTTLQKQIKTIDKPWTPSVGFNPELTAIVYPKKPKIRTQNLERAFTMLPVLQGINRDTETIALSPFPHYPELEELKDSTEDLNLSDLLKNDSFQGHDFFYNYDD